MLRLAWILLTCRSILCIIVYALLIIAITIETLMGYNSTEEHDLFVERVFSQLAFYYDGKGKFKLIVLPNGNNARLTERTKAKITIEIYIEIKDTFFPNGQNYCRSILRHLRVPKLLTKTPMEVARAQIDIEMAMGTVFENTLSFNSPWSKFAEWTLSTALANEHLFVNIIMDSRDLIELMVDMFRYVHS